MDSIAELLTATVTKKLKTNPVQQEKDCHYDLIRSCLRAIETIAQNVKGALDTPKYDVLGAKYFPPTTPIQLKCRLKNFFGYFC